MDWGSGTTARVAALALDRKGRLLPQFLVADAVRCALVLDLALADRLATDDDHLELDTAPTGFAPADALLRALEVEPERILTDWFGERRINLPLVADGLVEIGAWRAHSPPIGRARYRPVDRDQLARDLRTTSVGRDATAVDVAVVALGGAAHLIGEHRERGYGVDEPDPTDLVARADLHAWLLADAVAFLETRRSGYRWGGTVGRLGD